jgi:hypothetical protein
MRGKMGRSIDSFTLGMLAGAMLMLCLVWTYYAPS